MGAAAYNRGSQAIRESLASPDRTAFEIMDRINALPKNNPTDPTSRLLGVTVPKPFSPVIIRLDPNNKNVWWILDAEKQWAGFGYHYPSLAECVQNWDISLIGYDETSDTWETINN